MENHEAGPTKKELSKSEISGQDQSQGVGPNWDRNASKRGLEGPGCICRGPSWEKTLEPTHRGKDQVKTGQNIALRRREMSGLTQAKRDRVKCRGRARRS